MHVLKVLALRFALTCGIVSLGLSLAACGGGEGGATGGAATSSVSSSASSSSSSSSSGSVGSSSSSSSSSVSVSAPSALSYVSPQAYTVGTAIVALNPTVTGTVTDYRVSPALPAGLALNVATGQITGEPTVTSAAVVYTVTASNSIGATTFALSIAVRVAPPVVAVSYDIKQVILNWNAVSGATHYQVFKKPNGSSGYSQLGVNQIATTYVDSVAVHFTDWINSSYVVAACDSNGCTNSVAVSAFDSKRAIGYFKASNTDLGDVFGTAVALSNDGNTLAVGAWGEGSSSTGVGATQTDNSMSQSGAVYVFVRNGVFWQQQAYIKASNTDTNDEFGIAVALSADGNTLAVGADGEDGNAVGVNGSQSDNSLNEAGAVYVFTRNAAAWSQQAYIKASNTDALDLFGNAVSLSADGNTLAVGASVEASNATGVDGLQGDNSLYGAGAVYIFTRSAGLWSQQAYVKASNPDYFDRFGSAVAISADGNTLAVGAYGEDSNAAGINGAQIDNSLSDAGAVYIFDRSGGNWSQQAYIKASNTGAGDRFGWAVALSADGNILAAGAWGEQSAATGINGSQGDNSKSAAGAVYVFTRNGAAWSQDAYLKASNTDAGDSFGYAVALSAAGNTVAIGAYGEAGGTTGVNGSQTDNSTQNSGAVYLLVRSNGVWSQRAYVKASNADLGDYFGGALSLSGDGAILAVGAYLEDSVAAGINSGMQGDNSTIQSGAVYIY